MQLQLASAQSAEVQQLLLNVEKLSQLKQILADMKRGYDVASQGYNRVKNIAQGNFSLHELFLDGLLAVNPELRKYRRVKDIIEYQLLLIKEYKSAFNHFKSNGNFTPDEMDYLGEVYKDLFNRSIQNIDELTMILTASKLRMSDDERLTAIDRLYLDMQEKLSFLRSFNGKASLLDKQRAVLLQENRGLKGLYE
jgi:hypothetical protein